MNSDKLCPRCFSENIENGVCRNCDFSEETALRNPNALKRFVFLKDRYLVGELLGAGGFGITYKVYDSLTGKHKAIKEYFPGSFSAYRSEDMQTISVSEGYGIQYKKGLDSFYKEAQVLYGLAGIRSVVKVEDFFMENGTAYIVMEYVDGVSLGSICKASGGTVSFDEMLKQFIELAMTLDEVHLCGIAHRDVSPGNIMILPDGSVKLIDFGAARYVDKSNKTLSIVLKEGFAPIEQYYSKGKQGPWTDIYGLACSMYWYITGIRVPDAPTRQSKDDVVPIHKIREDIPKSFSLVIKKAMEVESEKRYRSISEMLRDIEPVMKNSAKENSGRENQAKDQKNPKKGFWGSLFKKVFRTESSSNNQKQFGYFAEVVCGPFEGMLFPLQENGIITIGRSEQYCSAVINARTISRLHCGIKIRKDKKGFDIIDYSSTGTYIASGNSAKGIKVSKTTPSILAEGELFWLGDQSYMMRIIKINY